MADLKVPSKTTADSFLLQDFIDDFSALNSEKADMNNPLFPLGITIPDINGVVIEDMTNKIIPVNANTLGQNPVGAMLWHDVLAFGNYAPTFETSANGIAWVAGTLDTALFAQKQAQNIQVLDATTQKAVRWTWVGTNWNDVKWLTLGYAWTNPSPNRTIKVEVSVDGITWTTVHTSTYKISAEPVWHYLKDAGGVEDYTRLTITANEAVGTIELACIKLLTSRWGDQGLGDEISLPYAWDKNRNVTFYGKITQLLNHQRLASMGGMD